jgi:putative ABC transport system permease protein
MNALDIIRTAIGNTRRSKLRTALTVVAIFIGAFTLTITSAIGTGVGDYIDTQVASIGAGDVLTVTKASDATTTDDGPAPYDPSAGTAASGGIGSGAGAGAARPGTTVVALTPSDLDAIKAISGILNVDPAVRVAPDYIEYGSNGKYQMTVNAAATLTKPDLAAGAELDQNSADNQVLLPTNYLDHLGFTDAKAAVGQTVTIGATDFTGVQHQLQATVAGVQNQSLIGGGVGLNATLTNAIQAVQQTGRPAGYTTSYSSATAHIDPNSTPAQVTAIKDALKSQGFTALTVEDQIGSFKTVIDGIVGVLNAFAVIALIAAGFGIINTLLMSVQERTREIGLMKAMGMSGARVYALFSTEAVYIGFLGSAIGAIVAIAIGTVISRVLSRTVLSGLPGLHIMEFAPGSIAVIVLVVMAIAFLAGTLPARRAARQNPIDALRYE